MKLQVWWIPQVPMAVPFIVEVGSLVEGKKLLDTLVRYDLFQFENKIKRDYVNTGGLEVLEDGVWIEWMHEDGTTIGEWTVEQLQEQENLALIYQHLKHDGYTLHVPMRQT